MEEYMQREKRRRLTMMVPSIVIIIVGFIIFYFFLMFVKEDPSHREYMNYELVIKAFIGVGIFMGGLIIRCVVCYINQYSNVWRMYQLLKPEEKIIFEQALACYKDKKNEIIISDVAICVHRTELGIVNGRNNCVFILWRDVIKLTYNQYFGQNIRGFEVTVQSGNVKQYIDLSVGNEASVICRWFKEKCPNVQVEYKGLSKSFVDHLD